MADDEVAAITENMVKMSPKMVRPASPIVDIYGDEEESYDVGGAINVSKHGFLLNEVLPVRHIPRRWFDPELFLCDRHSLVS